MLTKKSCEDFTSMRSFFFRSRSFAALVNRSGADL